MVATMKKYLFLTFHKEHDLFLHDLRNLGMIHVVEQDRTEVDEDNLYQFIRQKRLLEDAKKTLLRVRDNKATEREEEPDAAVGRRLISDIEKIENSKSSLSRKLTISLKERDTLKPWGNFDPEQIRLLESAGYRVNFFISPNNQYRTEWEDQHNIIVIRREFSDTYFITLSREDEDIESLLNLDSEDLPPISLDNLNSLIESLRDEIGQQDDSLRQLSNHLPSLEVAIKELESEIEFKKVVQSGIPVADDRVILLQGWAPKNVQPQISEYLESKAVYFEISDPTPEDDVPIKFKNNRFTKLFEPIAELYMLPKYNEIDLTPFFAPFYMLFFGLSLGDIGYGLFILLLTTLAKIIKKETLGKTLRGYLTLAQILGASTMVAGLLTGGFFGFELYEIDTPFWLNIGKKLSLDNSQMFNLSIILGIVQIMFGMFIKIFNRIKQFGFRHAISTIGWFLFLMSFILSYLLPSYMPMGGTLHKGIMILTAIAIIFFNSPGKNILLNIGMSLWDTYNMATGLLGDVLSYVRLFALGLSGGILAGVFTSLATGLSPGNAILGPIITILIFVIGHAINIFMNTLGAFVHPLRLTFVEFYNNSDFTGGGKKYNPFKVEG